MSELAKLETITGRADLTDQLKSAWKRYSTGLVRVSLVGWRGSGKSTLAGNLLIPATRPRVSPSIPLAYRAGQDEVVKVAVRAHDAGRTEVLECPLADFTDTFIDSVEQRGRAVVGLEATVPSELLSNGFALVDSPGVGGREGRMPQTLSLAAASDLVLFVTDASQEFVAAEVEFLRKVVEACPRTVVILAKTDVARHWRRILEANEKHLTNAGLTLQIAPVAAQLYETALELDDPELVEESGIPQLVSMLSNASNAARATQFGRLLADLDGILTNARGPIDAERAVLSAPDFRERVVNELKEKKEASETRARTALGWQQVLNDGITDLTSSVDFELNQSFRAIMAHIEAELDEETDADKKWPTLSREVQERVEAATCYNILGSLKGAEELAAKVGSSFALESEDLNLPDFGDRRPDLLIKTKEIKDLAKPQANKLSDRALAVMRGSQGGASMILIGAGVIGLQATILAPVALGAAAVLGIKALKDDRTMREARRRSEASYALRKYVDDASFRASQDSRERLREFHRKLRDHYSSLAEQHIAGLQAALKAAQHASELKLAQRDQRQQYLDRQVAILDRFRSALSVLAGE